MQHNYTVRRIMRNVFKPSIPHPLHHPCIHNSEGCAKIVLFLVNFVEYRTLDEEYLERRRNNYMTSVFWSITPCGPLKVNRRFWTSRFACFMFHAGFFLDLHYKPKGGDDISSETSVHFRRTARHYIPEDKTLHNDLCENPKSNRYSQTI
jgi:hypothetical protein